MKEKKGNIFTFHDAVIQREAKEKLLDQRAITIWLTGLSGSGKTSIAQLLEQKLYDDEYFTMLLDGDNVRDGINKNLDFSEAGREENIRRIAEVNKLFNNCGVITINCFVSPTVALRQMAKDIIGPDLFTEVYVNTSLEKCEERDIKGLYAKARAGIIPDFTGVSAPYEAPENADLILETSGKTAEESMEELFAFIYPKIQKQ